MKNLGRLILWLTCLVLPVAAQAVEVKNLYKASAIVADRSAQSLRQGGKAALAEVIIRVSGNSNALESFDISRALADPSRFMEQYGYNKTILENPETGLPEPVYELKVTFNARSINQLIRRAGLSIWARNRAEVLVWLVIEDETGRRFVNEATAPQVMETLQKLAARRGLPLVFPLNDLTDQLAVTPSDVWGMFMDPVVQGSERYAPAAVLAGKIYAPSATGNLASWTLHMDNRQNMLDSKGTNMGEILAPAVDYVADMLANKYAVTSSGGDADFIWLNVDGVQSLEDFARLTAYLEKLESIRQVNMGQLEEDSIRFRVYLESDIENLQQLLALDKKLIKISPQVPHAGVAISAANNSVGNNGVMHHKPAIPELNYHWYSTYVSAEP